MFAVAAMSVRDSTVSATSSRMLVAWLGVVISRLALAGHPMLTEDTGTQGVGNAELELGYSWASGEGDRTFLFQPQLSYGVAPTVDIIVQPSWLSDREPAQSTDRGFGDTAVDAKWRFYGSAPLSLGIRAGFLLPTSESDLGIPHGTVGEHALLVATLDFAPVTVDANLGMTWNPVNAGTRRHLYHASAAAQWAWSERMSLVADFDVDSNPDAARSTKPAVGLVGAIYTLRPGFDIDAGYRAALNSAAIAKQWLLGLTYRWAP
jgi:hypothetical protein